MASPQPPQQAHTIPSYPQASQLDWELPANGEKTTRSGPHAFIGIISTKLSTALPVRRRRSGGGSAYCGLGKKKFIIIASIAAVCLLALIIGLAAGLTAGKKNKAQNLPLPSNKSPQTGDFTYYDPGLGACGVVSTSEDHIVSVSHFVFDAASTGSNPNANPLCGKKIRATRYHEGVGAQRSVDLTVVDRCVGCAPTDIDTTTGVFDMLARRDDGRVKVTWAWLD
ncbi:hypothetical protein EJ05DRAFT_472069 [Pseudovirgaria hyperparasitica]|uniref:RlpA-like protein double-psi beta-barrel domain-containing protein n=1 Tax=Pseudovirgaria hyperparasitica TaxID=470096 RepID=A0A6A6WLV4_9PEZI|nr:uncharacterized protein EJ05DRAFT_472069 [Pseudovirgaria hyperparasitica]KAF2763138.1 hypothetical protein EJ05DRAFT_472069 [Pseudovirgaria hyperparasitica]